jgi:hypothetical protein
MWYKHEQIIGKFSIKNNQIIKFMLLNIRLIMSKLNIQIEQAEPGLVLLICYRG